MKISGSLTPYAARAARTCATIRSRNVRPSRTGSSDLARSIPIEVPSPPLSLIITVAESAAAACSSPTVTSLSRSGSVRDSMLSSAM